MAVLELTGFYEASPEGENGVAELARVIAGINREVRERPPEPGTVGGLSFGVQEPVSDSRLRWSVNTRFEIELGRKRDAERIGMEIERAAACLEKEAATAVGSSQTQKGFYEITRPMKETLLRHRTRSAQARVPLRHGDAEVLGGRAGERVRAVLTRIYPFSADLERVLTGVSVEIRGQDLLISGASIHDVAFVASAFVRAPRPIPKSPPPRPFWAYATAAVLVVTFALSWLSLSAFSVGLLAATTSVGIGWALVAALREQALLRTALGLVPLATFIAFAIVYSIAGIAGNALQPPEGEPLFLRDALLLSLSLGVTGGLFDLIVMGWLRSIAYLQMLLVAGYLAAAGLLVARAMSSRLDEALRDLASERAHD